MPGAYGLSVHGNAFVAERMAGDAGADGPLIQVNNVPKSDYVGLHQGWGVTFRGKASHENWFHVPIPTLDMFGHSAVKMRTLAFEFQTDGTAAVASVHVYMGRNRLGPPALSENLTERGPTFSRVFAEDIDVRGPLNVSILVRFGSRDSNVTFFGAGALFITP